MAVVLQLALAIDYAIILCHRFNEERFVYDPVNAAKEALKKALVEISSSSLTTIAGLAALSFMEFGIGKDLSFVMIKAIVLSMTTVFILMPGLLVLFSGLMDKTKHRSFMGNVHLLGKFSIKTRYIMPPIFAVLLIISFILSNKIPFLFSLNDIKAHRVTEQQVARDRIRENFGENNMLALIVPSGDYESERKLLDNLSAYEEVSRAVGLANTEAMGNYMLTDSLSPRQFAELVDLDLEVAQLLYSAYAINQEEYSKIVNGINLYEVPLIDMYQFLYEEVIQGFVSLDEEQMEELEEYYTLLSGAREQMEGENYSRMILYLDLKEESEETFEFLGTIRKEAERFYDKDSIFTIGESSNALDLSLTFDRDNLVISILSVLFVILILTFTFRSVGLPILLISVIQASIWINFSFPYIRGDGLYFLGFL
ncbi:MAG TPA: MMPL family transporter, partial [Tissierellaceae bacterium]|nr:MMPL family transporter [Tissierellaceae bacterium]